MKIQFYLQTHSSVQRITSVVNSVNSIKSPDMVFKPLFVSELLHVWLTSKSVEVIKLITDEIQTYYRRNKRSDLVIQN
jgi:hypothetical protein